MKITLTFDDKTYRDIRSAVFVKGLAQSAGGILDALVIKLVEKIDAGEEEWHVISKEEERRQKK